MWKLVPVFESMYGGFAAQLPLPTQILITGSHLVRERLLLVLLALVGIVILFRVAMSYSQIKRIFHLVLFRLPVYGLLFKKNIWAGFSRTLSLLMESGNPILQAVEVTAAAVDNPVFSEKLGDVYQQLQQGELLSQSLAETGMFSPLMIQLISTGEESGKIDELLRKSADFYETEIKVTVESMAAIIEPVLIIFLGGLVGGIIIALYLPIFSMGKLMG
jgi:type IV pilus assembly protein PilC